MSDNPRALLAAMVQARGIFEARLKEAKLRKAEAERIITHEEAEIRGGDQKVWELQELIFLEDLVLSEEIKKRRREILEKQKRVQRKDITIAEHEALTRKIEELITELPKHCSHPLILGREGFAGFHPEYENQWHGDRVCAVCGFREDSATTKADIYVGKK